MNGAAKLKRAQFKLKVMNHFSHLFSHTGYEDVIHLLSFKQISSDQAARIDHFLETGKDRLTQE